MVTEIHILLVLMVFALSVYILLDGYDLGIGMMQPLAGNDNNRKLMMDIIDTAWDANESWIILIGSALWAGFPGAYASLLPGNYLVIIFMILGFVIRGICLEFQSQSIKYNKKWGSLFCLSSWGVTICQGLIFAEVACSFININTTSKTLVMFVCVLFVVLIYCAYGTAWQYIKTQKNIASIAAKNGRYIIILLLITGSTVLYIFSHDNFQLTTLAENDKRRYFIIGTFILAAVAYILMFALYGFKNLKPYRLPFILCAVTNALFVIAIGLLLYPYFLYPGITVFNTASPESTQIFIITGLLLCMPFVLVYNFYSAYIFRGRRGLNTVA